MPLDREVKSALRDKVSTANKSNVAEIADEVEAARAGLPEDDKDYERLGNWLEDLKAVAGGSIPGRFEGQRASAPASAAPAGCALN